MKFIERKYGNTKEILATKNFEAIGVMVDATGITAGEDGRKIVPAGAIVGGKTNPVLTNDNEVVVDKNTSLDGAKAEGVLLSDVDVTNGDNVGTMVIRGQIDLGKLEDAGITPVDEAKEALKSRILFIR